MRVTRRQLLPAVVEEFQVALGETRGVRSFRLDDLASAPDEVLHRVVPVRGTARRIHLVDGFACVDCGDRAVRLFPADQVHLDAWNACDGRRDLGDVVDLVAGRWALDREDASALVRALFLRLLRARVLVPGTPGGP